MYTCILFYRDGGINAAGIMVLQRCSHLLI